MGNLRRVGSDVVWILLAVLSGALYGGWASSLSWLQGALVGLVWGLVLVSVWTIRRRRKEALPSR